MQKTKKSFIDQSTCIANLGVVPLFLLRFFLLTPVFFLLLFLRLFVIFEFETILLLRKRLQLIINRSNYLPILFKTVKAFLMVCLLYHIPSTQSSNSSSNSITDSYQNYILSIGEHKEINAINLKKFTVSNHEIVSFKHRIIQKKLLIKGKKRGYSELIIWKKSGNKQIYRIYVLSKTQQLSFLHTAQTLQSIGLSATLSGAIIKTNGKISKLSDYHLIHKLQKKYPKKIHLNVLLDKKLRNTIIADIYKFLFDEYIDEVTCYNTFIQITCAYNISNPPSNDTLIYLKELYHIKFLKKKNLIARRNYKLKLKLIQLENLFGQEINIGLNNLQGNISELFNHSLLNIIKKNNFLLAENNVDISTLAEPEFIIKTNSTAKIKIGADVPFNTSSANNVNLITKWKFAGLSLTVKLKKMGSFFEIIYKTKFTRPNQNGHITGGRENSSATLVPNTPIQLFQIGFQTVGVKSDSIPWISKIPILGKLFSSKSKNKNYKKITGIVVLEPLGP